MNANQLSNYSDVLKQQTGTMHLLLGNGFSIACDPVFKYNNIFQFAVDSGLSFRVQALFNHFGTTNFEQVARSLSDLEFSAKLYELLTTSGSTEINNDLEAIKDALISAIAQTHLETPNQLPESKRASCVAFLKPYENVFTTNYDLLLYWCSMEGLAGEELQFQDGFRNSIDDPTANYVVFSKRLGQKKGIFYMHGALHLFERDGEVRKHCWNKSGVTLTQNVISALAEDNYPLFVAEGESLRKLEHIQGSGYLSYCYQKLQAIKSVIVVYGSSLGDSDEHILKAIADSASPTVWLGVHGGHASSGASHMEFVGEKIIKRRSKTPGAKPVQIKYYDVSTAPIWNATSNDQSPKKSPATANFLSRDAVAKPKKASNY